MRVIVLALVMVLFGCIDPKKQVNAEARDPDLLYRAKCTACHRLYPPQKYTYKTSEAYVAKYGRGLSDEERQRLLGYLKENAKEENE